MSFFNRFRAQSNQPQGDQPAGDNKDQPLMLCVNSVSKTISAAEAAGKTIRQLFDQFMDDEVDTDALNSFVVTGNIRSGNTPAEPGMVIRAAVTSDSKA